MASIREMSIAYDITDPAILRRIKLTADRCPVCGDYIEDGDEIIAVEDFDGHKFHTSCFDDLTPAELLEYIGIKSERRNAT